MKRKPQQSKNRTPAGNRTHVRNASDRLLLQHADQVLPGKALLILINGTALAQPLTRQCPGVTWDVHTFEHFYLMKLVEDLDPDNDSNTLPDAEEQWLPEIQLHCQPDLPDQDYHTIVMPTDSRGTAELTRELLQESHLRLCDGGRLVVSTNNARDHWLFQYLKDHYGRITVNRDVAGVVYVARKSAKTVKRKQFTSEFAFRDAGELVRCVSRPGVFSHRRVDAGARALIKSLDLLPESGRASLKNTRRVVDMGTGCGSVAAAVAKRCPESQVLAVDSHVRAVQCAQRTAEVNDCPNVAAMLTSNGVLPEPAAWDLFLCNPPYYSDFRISEIFLQSADAALRSGGRLHLVTKLKDSHANRMAEIFGNVESHAVGEYHVLMSTQH